MKRRINSWALAACVASAALISSSCSTTETRISAHPEIYQNLSARDRSMVTQGRIREGMSENAVWLSWGAPDQKLAGRSHGQSAETWIYTSTTSVYDPFPRFGGGFGPYGSGFYGGGGYFRHHGHFAYRNYGFYDPFYDPFYYSRFEHVSYPYKTVSFQGGRVVGYQFLAPPNGQPGY